MKNYLPMIAHFIYCREARLDRHGHLQVHHPPAGDGGGEYEVAGFTAKHNPFIAQYLKSLLDKGEFYHAEMAAKEKIIQLTDTPIILWDITDPGLEAILRDITFNRGLDGCARTLQIALGVTVDGRVGPITKRALAAALADVPALLLALRAARETYERQYARRDESSPFWNGLVNRWEKCLYFAQTLNLPEEPTDEPERN